MWIVYDDNEGLIGIFDDEKEANREYEWYKQNLLKHHDGEFYGDERVVIAKVEKQIYSTDTKEPVNPNDKNSDSFWEFKEENYI